MKRAKVRKRTVSRRKRRKAKATLYPRKSENETFTKKHK
jgi:hypothetical protein